MQAIPSLTTCPVYSFGLLAKECALSTGKLPAQQQCG